MEKALVSCCMRVVKGMLCRVEMCYAACGGRVAVVERAMERMSGIGFIFLDLGK